jgi:hypothetical protein
VKRLYGCPQRLYGGGLEHVVPPTLPHTAHAHKVSFLEMGAILNKKGKLIRNGSDTEQKKEAI